MDKKDVQILFQSSEEKLKYLFNICAPAKYTVIIAHVFALKILKNIVGEQKY